VTDRGAVVVTGAGQGIGAGIAARLGADGWHVWCVDLVGANAATVAERIVASGGSAVGLACDLGDPAAIADLWSAIDAAGSTATALVNNAGIFPRNRAVDIPLEEWNRVLAVNLTGGFLMDQAFVRRLAGRAAAIVNIASGQALRPGPMGAHYAASKGAILNLTRALAAEWGPIGVRVNTIVPGVVDTAQPRLVLGDDDFAAIAAANPLGRLATPDDIAAGVAILLSADAAFITGQMLAVNGGGMMF